jgi:hypothetical protein
MSRRVGAGPAGTACARAPIAQINKVANRVISHSNLAADLMEPWSANWTSEHLDYHRNGMISNARPEGHWLTIMRGSGRILVGILIAGHPKRFHVRPQCPITRVQSRSIYQRFRCVIQYSGRVTAHLEIGPASRRHRRPGEFRARPRTLLLRCRSLGWSGPIPA